MNSDTLIPVALDLLVKSTGILLLACAANSLWRNASAAQRCLIWGTAFTVLLLLPLTLLVPPQWSFALKRDEVPPPLPATTVQMQVADEMNSSAAPVLAATPAAWHLPRISLTQAALGIWITGVALVLGWRMLGTWQLHRLRRQSVVLTDDRVTEFTARLARECHIARSIELRESTHVSVPLTWGSVHPVLLLPRKALSWSDASLEAALRHELGHIRHGDALTRLLMSLVCAAFWPQVLAWIAAKAWRTAQEQACDDLVLRAGTATQDYAMQLLDAARRLHVRMLDHAPVMAMAKASTLETRLSAIMDDTRDRRPLHGKAWLAGSSTALASLALCAMMQLRAEDKAVPSGDAASVVEIRAKILEVSQGTADEMIPAPGQTVRMSDQQTKDFITKLSAKKGVDLLSMPTVITRDGQKATLEVSREFLKQDTTVKQEEKVGVFFSVVPRREGKDGIHLSVDGVVREFNGFRTDPVNSSKEPLWLETKLNAQIADTRPDTTALLAVDSAGGTAKRKILFLITARPVEQASTAAVNNHGATTITAEGKARTTLHSSPIKAGAQNADEVSKIQKKAEDIIIPTVEFREASLAEALDFLRAKSKEHDPAKKGLDIVLANPPPRDARMSLSLKNVPLVEALRYVTELAGAEYQIESEAVVIRARSKEQPATVTRSYRVPPGFLVTAKTAKAALEEKGVSFPVGGSAVVVSEGTQLVVKTTRDGHAKVEALVAAAVPASPPSPAAPVLPLMKKAGEIIIPRVQLREATVAEAVDFLKVKSKELDKEKHGVNIIVRAEGVALTQRITLDLQDVPLSEALKYVAELAGLKVKGEPYAYLLEPK